MPLHPVLKGLLFALIPLAYYLLDFLNFSQAGKSAGLAFFALTPLFFWLKIYPEGRAATLLKRTAFAFALIIVINMGFHGFVRALFGMEQDDVALIEALFNTTPSESSEFFLQNLRFIVQHLTLALLFFAIYWFSCLRPASFSKKTATKATYTGAIVFSLLLALVHFNPTLRRFNPIVYFPYYYTKWQNTVEKTRLTQQKLDQNQHDPQLATLVYKGPEQNTVVLVIGESDTRHNWSLYGYPRNTNEQLGKRKNELLIFKHVTSADGATIGSLQKMLTAATLQQPDLWQTSPDILTMAKRLGYTVFWLDNQGLPNNGIISIFASHADKTVFTNKSGNLGESSYDEVLMQPYLEALKDPSPKKMIIVHVTGEHPSYVFRYPDTFAYFDHADDAVTQSLKNAGRAIWAITLRNQYDNAVRYLDFNLNALLQALQQASTSQASFLYIADHGQDVAHNTNFSGHNKNAKQMWEVPMIFWSSALTNEDIHQLESMTQEPYSADYLDSTLLGLLSGTGYFYHPEKDALLGYHQLKNTQPTAVQSNNATNSKGTL